LEVTIFPTQQKIAPISCNEIGPLNKMKVLAENALRVVFAAAAQN
jgi:hypothetical protein